MCHNFTTQDNARDCGFFKWESGDEGRVEETIELLEKKIKQLNEDNDNLIREIRELREDLSNIVSTIAKLCGENLGLNQRIKYLTITILLAFVVIVVLCR